MIPSRGVARMVPPQLAGRHGLPSTWVTSHSLAGSVRRSGERVFSTARKGLELLGPSRRRRFMAVGLLSVLVSGLEAVSALLVLMILRFVLEPDVVPDFPVVGDVTRYFPGMSYEQLVLIATGVFAVFFLVRGALFLFQQYALTKVAENTGVALASRLVRGYLRMPYEFHLQRNSSELVRSAYDDVQQVVTGVFTPMATLVAEIIMTVALLTVLVLASVQATVVAAVVFGLVVGVTLAVVQPRLKTRGQQRQRAAHNALQHLQQGFGGLRDITILGKEDVFGQDFDDARQEMAEAQYHRAVLGLVPRVTMETGFLLLVLAALALAIATGEVAGILSTLGVFAYAGLRLQPSLQKIANAASSVRYAEAAIDSLSADLALLAAGLSEHSDQDRDPHPLPFRKQVELRGVRFRYDGAPRDALRGIDVTIARGESIGIAGATGGGKTTLLDILCGLLQPTSGSVLVDGVDIRGRTRAWQRNVGVVHQNSFLIDDTIRRNIALGVADHHIDQALIQSCIDTAQLRTLVEQLPDGEETRVGERGIRLSGGQRQRITLARALYRRPAVLVLDEGTAALDAETERAIVRGIEKLAGDTTIIMVAHRLTTIEQCDRILFLEDGRVAASGPFSELIRSSASFRRMARGSSAG